MSTLIQLPIASIAVETQVRKKFDAAAHLELVESIKTHGILQPLLVRAGENVSDPVELQKFTLIAGERRLRAAKDAGLEEVPCSVLFSDATHHTEMQIVENIQREELTLEETAGAVDALYRRYGKMSDVAKALSKSMTWVSKHVAVAQKLGKLATELLAGGHTQDVELLTTLTRAEELKNAFPRVEQLVEVIKAGKAGRAEVLALYNQLKDELAHPEPEVGEGSEEDGDETGPDNTFTAVNGIHLSLCNTIADAFATPAKYTDSQLAAALDSTVRGYRAHFVALINGRRPGFDEAAKVSATRARPDWFPVLAADPAPVGQQQDEPAVKDDSTAVVQQQQEQADKLARKTKPRSGKSK